MRYCRSSVARLLVLGLTCLSASTARAIQHGDILVADRIKGLIRVDSLGTAQASFSSTYNAHGFVDVVTDTSGRIFALSDFGIVFRIDARTEALTVLTQGGNLQFPSSITFAPDGSLLVCEGGPAGGVIRVDPATGLQTVIVHGQVLSPCVSDGGEAYVMVPQGGPVGYQLHRLDLGTGATLSLSDTLLHLPLGATVEASGKILITDHWTGGDVNTPVDTNIVYRADPATGAMQVLSINGLFMAPWGVTTESAGTILIADNQGLRACSPPPPGPKTCTGAVLRLDPVTGTQTIVSEQGLFADVTGIDVFRGRTTSPVIDTAWTFALEQPTPNPARLGASMQFSLPATMTVTLAVFDMQGRRVAVPLDHATLPEGAHSVSFSTAGWKPGAYYCRLAGGTFKESKKLFVFP